MLLLVGLPQECIALFDSPQARRLPLRDVEMQMSPASAAALLPEDAELLSHRDPGSGTDRGLDVLQVAVAVIPAAAVEQIDDVVALVDRRVLLVAGEDAVARGHHQAVGGGDDVDEPLRAPDVEA